MHFSKLIVEFLLSRSCRCCLTRWWMMDGDVYDGCWIHILVRLFERCVVSGLVKVWNRQCATTIGYVYGVVLL